MKVAAFLISGLGLVSVASQAEACSGLNLVAQATDAEGYDPNARTAVPMQIELLLIDGTGETSCAANVIEIESQTTLGVKNLGNSTSVISGISPPGQSAFDSYTDSTIRLSQAAVEQLVSSGRLIFDYAWIGPGIYLPAGRYSNTLGIRLNGHEVAIIEPEIYVFPAVRLLGDMSSGYGHVDLGTLEKNDEVALNFVYQSNVPLNVRAQSLNQGRLVHEDGSSVYAIPYVTFINGKVMDTNGLQSLTISDDHGARKMGTILLRLDDIGTPVAGQYSDTLTLNLTID